MTRRTSAALALLAAAALGGCAGVPPGVAAAVGSERVTVEEVDTLAAALCTIAVSGGGGGQSVPTRAVRSTAASVLVSNALALQLGEADGVEVPASLVADALRSAETQVAALEGEQLDAFVDAYSDFVRADRVLAAVGEERLAAYAESVDLEVDPRFGTVDGGLLQPVSGSLSQPVSESAVAAAQPELPADIVSALPPAQTCR